MIQAMLFVNPVSLPSWLCLWLIVPLCVAVSVVYKTVRVHHLSQLPRQVLTLMAYMFLGLGDIVSILDQDHRPVRPALILFHDSSMIGRDGDLRELGRGQRVSRGAPPRDMGRQRRNGVGARTEKVRRHKDKDGEESESPLDTILP